MNILFVAAEVAPYVSVGGLSQVMYFLPRALSRLNHDVRIFTPKYGSMENSPNKKNWKFHLEYEGLRVPVAHSFSQENEKKKQTIICNVKSYSGHKQNAFTYFLENREYYELRANVFMYSDDHLRFALLSKGCLEWLLQIHKKAIEENLEKHEYWWPDVINCNDWHTAYLMELAKKDERYRELFEKVPIVLTVHNFAFQGNYDFRYGPLSERDNGTKPLAPLLSPKLQKQNALLRGIQNADAITTVSPTHAVEVLTPEYAEGLEDELQKVRSKLTGILNGLDTKEFNPATDPIIKKQYTEKSYIHARKENKLDLQKSFLLPEDPDVPLLAMCGRLSQQKGWDLLIEVFPHLFAHYPKLQLIIVGGGDDGYRNKLLQLQQKYPKQIGIHPRADFRLPRKLFAGADIFLIPSIFEPGGIVALEALRYGSVPLIRRTGGLTDIISDFDPATCKGNGFSFAQKDPWALYGAIVQALTIYQQPKLWKKLVANCLACDFSWDNVAVEYDNWYRKLLEERKRATSLTPHPAYILSTQ